jgi:putative ATP-binding cassette transporter
VRANTNSSYNGGDLSKRRKKMKRNTNLILLFLGLTIYVNVTLGQSDVTAFDQGGKVTESYLNGVFEEAEIPGAQVIIIKSGETVFNKSFGYSNVATRSKVTTETVFELGSTSKAFTALGLQLLIDSGQLSLDTNVNDILPNVIFKYDGITQTLLVKNFLQHSSGIEFSSISNIPESASASALEDTVQSVVEKNSELEFEPGSDFLYATINYDILGLLIEKVTGMKFEQYMRERVLEPLGLGGVYVWNVPVGVDLATGYKPKFLAPSSYSAPSYRGNVPAGYFLANANGIERWLHLQLGLIDIPTAFSKAIASTHIPNYRVSAGVDNTFYAKGWVFNNSKHKVLEHSGANPNYSSYIQIYPELDSALVIMTNVNSSSLKSIGEVLGKKLLKPGHSTRITDFEETPDILKDQYRSLDLSALVTGVILFSTSIVLLLILLNMIYNTVYGDRVISVGLFHFILYFVLGTLVCALLISALYILPNVILQGISWGFLFVWAPQSIQYLVFVAATFIVLLTLFVFYSFVSKSSKESPIPNIVILTIVSGFGNFLLIFTILQAIKLKNPLEDGLIIYFLVGLFLYVIGQKMVRNMLVVYSTDLVFKKRMEVVDKIVSAPYHQIIEIKKEELITGLNNDTEAISKFPEVIVGLLTSIVTLFGCFLYLGVISVVGLFISIAVIFVAMFLYFKVGQSAEPIMVKQREYQDVFFRFVNDLVGGLKELNLSKHKAAKFTADFSRSSAIYRNFSQVFAIKYVNAFVIGELLFTLVIGVVAFLFKVLISDFNQSDIVVFVVVFLYMTGPIHGVMNSMPALNYIKVCWLRLNQLIDRLSDLSQKQNIDTEISEPLEIDLHDVEYSYSGTLKGFTLGPVSMSFKTGEITFITGGNGSGKSTLINLILGLYQIKGGQIKINGVPMEPEQLSQQYGAVLADYHLFQKTYGLNDRQLSDADYWLKKLRIEDKVSIDNGKFSTLDLSTGQKKRLAMLVCLLENKPVLVFDEWAAEQDPEFRRFFYTELLPTMKKNNKCVIAITHDDQYFTYADNIIKLDSGSLNSSKALLKQ